MATTHSTIGSVPNLVLVTDRHATGGRALADVVERALGAGLPAVQLRDKDLKGGDLFRLAVRLRALTRETRALLFVNDRVDVALAVEADGVHLGAGALPVEVARTLVPPGTLMGKSIHGAEEATDSTADFVFFGPVYDTPSKRSMGPPQGVSRLRAAAAAARVPVIAIGGLDASRTTDALDAGAHGVAVIRAILAAPDPENATRDLLTALER